MTVVQIIGFIGILLIIGFLSDFLFRKTRFPDIPRIDYLLSSAGFTDIEHREVIMENLVIDEEYLQKVKNKYVSTYCLLPQSEFEAGVKGLEEFIKSKSKPEVREWRGTFICGRKHHG